MTFTECSPPASAQVGPYVPRIAAVSPAGRVVAAVKDDTLAVYAPHETGGTCTYSLDPDYGDAGTVTFNTPFFQVEWDYQERLYVTGQLGFSSTPQQPGSLYRVSPGGRIDACKYNQTADARITDEMPDAMAVLPDGSKAFLYWSRDAEDQLDLADPSLGDDSEACNFAFGIADVQHYTSALSVSPGGLLFLSMMDGEQRAVETDVDLNPILVFGGSASGTDGPGLAGVRALSRCPVGYCAVSSEYTLKQFSPSGAFLGAGHIGTLIGGRELAGELLAPGLDGSAWLRGTWIDLLGPNNQEAILHLVAKR